MEVKGSGESSFSIYGWDIKPPWGYELPETESVAFDPLVACGTSGPLAEWMIDGPNKGRKKWTNEGIKLPSSPDFTDNGNKMQDKAGWVIIAFWLFNFGQTLFV